MTLIQPKCESLQAFGYYVFFYNFIFEFFLFYRVSVENNQFVFFDY